MSATFIQVHQDNVLLSFHGDSGGPWFTGNTALGLMHAYADVPNGRDAFYMAVDYIQSTGLNVLVNCPATGC